MPDLKWRPLDAWAAFLLLLVLAPGVALAQQAFGLTEAPVAYDVLLHFATLLATVVILRKRCLELLHAPG